ncbi:MAG: diguanylate cyclase/phosphodiesterase (GGDEF & EAL domains) with PAS/PAC sensor(s) [uncultured Ramlibacter sp.]|uniref:Diguanylate cyclase/phosphodiesterase (GGDEF & EAL domains) with PAS/PAC sensor(S) n=1 Tax=uncultured Ramlibacter sp. TaxID=260755 RepID=A0A6J4P3C7_9BURK|nr:MAG: diguanylate cyclase/phosphodiesterase (GGDEF & EAL domains) with PAS/PAC sensor(s) [uncultured Ramlibacter sp.]
MTQLAPPDVARPAGWAAPPTPALPKPAALPWPQRLAMLTSAAARVPADEAERLAHLREFAILDTEPEDAFDRLVQLAAAICGTPMAALSFVDARRQWYKARLGVPVPEVPRHQGLCAQAILAPGRLLEIVDASQSAGFDPQLHGPAEPPVRYYAGMPLRTRDGSAVGTLCVMDHVPRRLADSQRDALEKLAQTAADQLELRRQLRVATQTDRLTGLPNWLHFESLFDSSKPQRGVLSFVRLKTVGQINSAHGFRVADALVRQAAERLRGLAEGQALIGRVKRGLFILFFPEADPDTFARDIAPALTRQLQAPYAVNQFTLVCPVHLGFAAFPRDGTTLEEVVGAADSALQGAIERDEPVAFFDKSVDTVSTSHFRLEPQLRNALAQQQFINYYQPKIDLATGRIHSVEALIRWVHPERGLVPPSEFVPALEATGLIRDVGRHILERAVADWARWRDAGLPAPRVAVNVAAAQLRNDDFLQELRNALQPVGGDARALSLEVTESVLISNMEQAIRVLTQVRALGVPVAIDDFGTGYSSLAYLVTLPVDEVKIDRTFIRKLTDDLSYRDIVATCISLARNLNLKVVAEGVETQEQARELRLLRCDLAQGFLYSPPVPAEQLAGMLRSGGRLA